MIAQDSAMLEKAFDILNRVYFGSALPKVMITCKNRHPSPICTQFEHHFHALKPHLLYHSYVMSTEQTAISCEGARWRAAPPKSAKGRSESCGDSAAGPTWQSHGRPFHAAWR